jgi:hypothetical protein
VGEIVNSTIADNEGVGLLGAGRLRATNSVIANNKKQNCQLTGSAAVLEDGGANLQFPGNVCSPTIPSADPLLDNFYVPDPKSPLQNAGLNTVCLTAPILGRDVYGQRRPRSMQCTIGAVEGDIDQLLHHLGVVGPQGPPSGGPGPPGGGGGPPGEGGGGKGATDLILCGILLLLLLMLLVALALLYRRLRRQPKPD